ncbi:KR domain-containing protein, partial [Tahibacter sp. P2K]|nr:KR domain-containing protein [Tahibacter harae]
MPLHATRLSAATAAAAPAAADSTIAIIGMSGRLPLADDADTFWRNLLAGRDCIREVPAERWDWRAIYGDPLTEGDRTRVKWGGFIDGLGDFDPLFFGIAPRDAELMDPQHRLLLTHAWLAFEDAGYAPSQLAGSNTAVFVGIGDCGYGGLIASTAAPIEGASATATAPSIGPSRVSYFFDLHGPSEPVDTACSSALIALHRAVHNLQSGQCELALAGGVNAMVTPWVHISFSKAGMLCEDGRCKTFSAAANGYVRGEGIGLFVLKPLAAAERDGDNILGLVRASGVNHGGRASSLTAPNTKAQAELIRSVYSRAGLDPRSIGYLEAHGTGTPLGDPVEVNALKAAFADLYAAVPGAAAAPTCALGSVKTNIGHLEFAAGAASVLKVLLQLRHRTLAPSLHCATVNPYIDFSGSPFRLVPAAEPWTALTDADGRELPRRAGISSFGFGGANAHVVIEEYRPPARTAANAPATVAIPLSARTPALLLQRCRSLRDAVHDAAIDAAGLADIAYTLQVGREPMEQRLGLLVRSAADLAAQLEQVLAGALPAGAVRGEVKRPRDSLQAAASPELRQNLARWQAAGDLAALLQAWAGGAAPDWRVLYGAFAPRRVSLPGYAFELQRYWVPQAEPPPPGAAAPVPAAAHSAAVAAIPARAAETAPVAEILLFSEQWQPAAAGEPAAGVPPRRLVCVLADAAAEAPLRQVFAALAPSLELHCVPAAGSGDAAAATYAAAFGALARDGAIDAVLALQTLTDTAATAAPAQASLMQGLLQAGQGRAKVLIAAAADTAAGRLAAESLVGFERSLGRQDPLRVAVLGHERAGRSWQDWAHSAWAELGLAAFESSLHGAGGRRVLRRIERVPQPAAPPLRRGGSYLITGGAGGLGLLLAEHLAQHYQARLILTGRRPPDAARQARLDALRAQGSEIHFVQADVTDAGALRGALALAGPDGLAGVFHAAGVAALPLPLAQLPLAHFGAVLAPKLAGTDALYAALDGLSLDFVCLFSSSAAVLGDFGSADYAIANRYLAARAADWRAQRPAQPATAVLWPLWQDGGMGADAAATALYLKSSGQAALSTAAGLDLLPRLLAQSWPHSLVLCGEPRRLRALAGTAPSAVGPAFAPPADGPHRRAEYEGLSLEQCALADLKAMAASLLKLGVERLHEQENLADFGFDSISLAEFARRISARYAISVVPSLFFSHASLGALAAHLAQAQAGALAAHYAAPAPVQPQAAAPAAVPRPLPLPLAA